MGPLSILEQHWEVPHVVLHEQLSPRPPSAEQLHEDRCSQHAAFSGFSTHCVKHSNSNIFMADSKLWDTRNNGVFKLEIMTESANAALDSPKLQYGIYEIIH